MIRQDMLLIDHRKAVNYYIKAVNKGVLKVMSKMGISTLQSYRGAQIFEAIGLNADFVNTYFTNTPTRISGIGIDEIAEEVAARHRHAYPDRPVADSGTRLGRTVSMARRRASTTCTTPKRCTSCSTRRARTTTGSSRNTAL